MQCAALRHRSVCCVLRALLSASWLGWGWGQATRVSLGWIEGHVQALRRHLLCRKESFAFL